MNNANVHTGILSAFVLGAALVAACSSGSSHAARPLGMAGVVIRDGTVQSSDGRTVTSVFVEVSRITLHQDGDGEHGDDTDDDQGDGNGENLNSNDDGGDGDQGGGHHQHGSHGVDVVVFDMFANNGGVPRVVDLLTLTNSGALFNMLRIPVGTYSGGAVTLVGASAIFEDDPTQTPVPLAIDGDEGSRFDFDFHPPVAVTEAATTIAAIDIVPVITLEGTGYTLSHDGDSDESGECGDGDLEIEVEGTVGSVTGDHIHLGDYGLEVDLSGLDPVLVTPGMQVEVSGYFAEGVLVAQSLEIED
jgi:hypothetical protein